MAFVPQMDFSIAAYASGSAAMANVEVDGSGLYDPPKFSFKPYSKMITNGAGMVMGAGWATAEWNWDVMTDTQRDWLRTYIPGASADLYIKTKTMDYNETYTTFRCVGIWPVDSEEHDVTRRVKFTIKFQRMVVVS